jgi:hypothetical protein
MLADSFDGKPFEAVNDPVIDKKDGVYFTLSNSRTVLYALPGAKVINVFADPVERINGITPSRDEKDPLRGQRRAEWPKRRSQLPTFPRKVAGHSVRAEVKRAFARMRRTIASMPSRPRPMRISVVPGVRSKEHHVMLKVRSRNAAGVGGDIFVMERKWRVDLREPTRKCRQYPAPRFATPHYGICP